MHTEHIHVCPLPEPREHSPLSHSRLTHTHTLVSLRDSLGTEVTLGSELGTGCGEEVAEAPAAGDADSEGELLGVVAGAGDADRVGLGAVVEHRSALQNRPLVQSLAVRHLYPARHFWRRKQNSARRNTG